jgi:uncharacterized protein with LGFP repeats
MQSRSRAPTMMLTAVAATVVIVAWLTNRPGPPSAPAAQPPPDTQLSEQPLVGLGGGVTVRELSQDTPFSLVAMTGDVAGTSTRVRAKRRDGSWGPWYQTEYETAAPDSADPTAPAEAPRGTDPVFVGNTTTVQIVVTRPMNAPVTRGPGGSAPIGEGLGYRPATTEQPFGENISAVLISPPQSPPGKQWTPPAGVTMPGQAPAIISRAEWGADESLRCGKPQYDNGIRAGVVHHTAGSNDYSPLESAGIVKAIYTYHSKTLGWCDIAYNALVDKYGQVFEGRAGGIDRPVEGSHTGGFNRDTFGVAMLGDFDQVRPSDIQLRMVGRLMGWKLGLYHVDPRGTAILTSAGGRYTNYPRGATPTMPAIFTHRDVGATDCPGAQAYAAMDEIRDIAARFNEPARPPNLEDALRGGAILAKWESLGAANSPLGAPTSPEASADGPGVVGARYVTFDRGAMYWSADTGPEPVTGAIYAAWASLGYERGLLGLPTSGEIDEPQWVVQNFQHGTLNFDRETGMVTRVVDGVAQEIPPPPPSGPPVQLERFTPILIG